MNKYNIKDLEVLSGIKAHTLRIWEQRYSVLVPKRTDTNIRTYDDDDLKTILNISLLNQNGFKISKIATMSGIDMRKEVAFIADKNLQQTDQIHALTLSMIDLDEIKFDKIMSKSVLQIGIEATMVKLIYPFLTKIGLMWQSGVINPAQEHFISNLIRQKLIVALDGQYNVTDTKADKYLLYLPEGENHEINLLFSNYILKARQKKTIYLGQNVPFEDLKSICKIHEPKYIITAFTSFTNDNNLPKYIKNLSSSFPNSKIILSGLKLRGMDIECDKNVNIFHKIDDLINFVEDET